MLNKLFGIGIILTILVIGICITTSSTYETVKPLQDERAAIKIAVCNDLNKTMYYNIERLDHRIIEYKGEWFPVAMGEIDANTCDNTFSKYHARIYRVSWYDGHAVTKIITAPDKCIKIIFYPDHTEFIYKEE